MRDLSTVNPPRVSTLDTPFFLTALTHSPLDLVASFEYTLDVMACVTRIVAASFFHPLTNLSLPLNAVSPREIHEFFLVLIAPMLNHVAIVYHNIRSIIILVKMCLTKYDRFHCRSERVNNAV